MVTRKGSWFQSPSRRGDHRLHTLQRKPPLPRGFQSPSRRGDHRLAAGKQTAERHTKFQSPSRRGDHRLPGGLLDLAGVYSRFNPLHVGAIIGCQHHARVTRGCRSFNPLHVGAISGCPGTVRTGELIVPRFNPLHVGAIIGCNVPPKPALAAVLVSIPFTSGRSSVVCGLPVLARLRSGFNPLHVGAIIGCARNEFRHGVDRVSIPFTSGRSSVAEGRPAATFLLLFQSPSRRGDHRLCSKSLTKQSGFRNARPTNLRLCTNRAKTPPKIAFPTYHTSPQ